MKAPPTALDRECRDIFNLVSADGGRTIAVSELDAALCLLGVKSPGPAQLEALLLEADPRWRNEITFSRFRAAVWKIDNGAAITTAPPPPTKSGAGSSPSSSRAATAPAGAAKQSVGTLLKGSTKPRWRMPTLGWGASAPPPHGRDDPTFRLEVRSSSRDARLTTDAVTDAWRLHCQSKLASSVPGANAISDERGIGRGQGVTQAKPVHVHNLKQATAHVFAHADGGAEVGCCMSIGELPWTTAE